jgi:hypothetical protein
VSQQINLLGDRFRKKRFSFTSAAAMSYGIGIAAALALLLALYEDRALRAIEAQAQASARALKETSLAYEKAAGAQTPTKPSPELEARVVELNAQLKARQEVIDALKSGAVGSTAGFSEYMRVFSRQSLDGLWLTGFDIVAGANELTITGRALNADLVPAYLQRLNAEGPMKGRQFASMVINQAQGLSAASAQDPKNASPSSLPAYVEFRVSTGDLAGTGSRSEPGAGSPQGPAR